MIKLDNIISRIKIRLGVILNNYGDHYFPPIRKKNPNDFKNSLLNTPDKVNNYISMLLESDSPCMISRFGSNELNCTIYYGKWTHPLWIIRNLWPFWIPKCIKDDMKLNAGFFSNDNKSLCAFSDLLIKSAKDIDLLGSWVGFEKLIEKKMNYETCPLLYLEPYWSNCPWTKSLKGKKILVVHPFADTIKEQYRKRALLFDNLDVLPEFSSLAVIKAIQTIGGDTNGYKSWFDALHYMEKQIDSVDYDIALIGCGAYGMPLAYHCKKMGKKSVHLGGALQLLFGIRGHRWEENGYGSDFGLNYKQIINNPYWVRAKQIETPLSAFKVEDACYW